MNKKLYNSEVRELAKQLYLGKGGEHTFYGDRFPSACIIRAKNMIDVLEKEGYYDEEQQQELSETDKRISNLLRRDVLGEFGLKLDYKMRQEFNMKDAPIIADIIRCGRERLLNIYGLGKKTIRNVDMFFDDNGITWDMDLTKYGL